MDSERYSSLPGASSRKADAFTTVERKLLYQRSLSCGDNDDTGKQKISEDRTLTSGLSYASAPQDLLGVDLRKSEHQPGARVAYKDLGIVSQCTHIRYSQREKRLRTLENCRVDANRKRELAENGFFFKGFGKRNPDTFVCFQCGVVVSKWPAGKTVLEIHGEMSPECAFVKFKAMELSKAADENDDSRDAMTSAATPAEENSNTAESRDQSTFSASHPAIQAVEIMGYPQTDALKAARLVDGELTPEKLLKKLYALEESREEIMKLRQENEKLRQEVRCKSCQVKDSSVASLPCGHIALCQSCAFEWKKCNICGKIVNGFCAITFAPRCYYNSE